MHSDFFCLILFLLVLGHVTVAVISHEETADLFSDAEIQKLI